MGKSERAIGSIILPIRLVGAWLFLSAVWRRLVLAPQKHDIESPAWIGNKINTFLPQSNGFFHDFLQYLVQDEQAMDVFAYVFTFSELILGLLLLLGILGRLSGVMLIGMAVGLMHTAGWLGPTCLDEWQIASLLTVIGLVLVLNGFGGYSLDHFLSKKGYSFTKHKGWLLLTAVGDKIFHDKAYKRLTLIGSLLVVMYVMGANQLLHGGVWGKLHNDSTKVHLEVTNLRASGGEISFEVYRDKGPETYGAFVDQIVVVGIVNGEEVGDTLSLGNQFRVTSVDNKHLLQVQEKNGYLLVPLGAKAVVTVVGKTSFDSLESVVLRDVSGARFRSGGLE